MLLDSHGRPITSKRKVILQIHLVDHQAMSSQPKTYALGFELDRPDRPTVATLLSHVSRNLMAKLEEIDFFQEGPVPGEPPS